MKHIFTLITALLLLGGHVSAQQTYVSYKGKKVENRSTIFLKATVEELFDDYFEVKASDDGNLLLHSARNKEVDIFFKIEKEESKGKYVDIGFCPDKIGCFSLAGAVEEKDFSITMPSSKLPLNFHSSFESPKVAASSKVYVEVKAKGQPKLEFYIVSEFNPETGGIDDLHIATPLLQNGKVSYDFSTQANRLLSVYNALGQCLVHTDISQKGVYELPQYLGHGIFMVSITENGRTIWTRKLCR